MGTYIKRQKVLMITSFFSPLTPDVCYWFLQFQCQCPVRRRKINTQYYTELFIFFKKWKLSKESNSLKTQITTLTWSFVPSCVMEMWAGSSWPIRRKKDFQWRIKKKTRNLLLTFLININTQVSCFKRWP